MKVSDIAAVAGDAIAVLGTIVSLVAAVAAWRSAKSASDATGLMREQLRGELVREVNLTTNRVVIAAEAVEALASSLAAVYAQEVANRGSANSSGVDQIRQQCGDYKASATAAREKAEAILSSGIEARSDEELTRILLHMDMLLAQQESLRAKIRLALDDVLLEGRFRSLRTTIATGRA